MISSATALPPQTCPNGFAAADRGQQQYFHALQNTFEILINSLYGYLGFAQGHFADFDAAARVTQIGPISSKR